MLIYFAGPLFCQAERTFNQQLTEKLEASGFRVFLPQRDGVEADPSVSPATTQEEWGKAVFRIDTQHLLTCDIFLFILDGRVPDEGACVELGLAYGQKVFTQGKKLLIGLQTDRRAGVAGSLLNPMIRIPLDCLTTDEETLLATLKFYKEQGTLPSRV